MKAQMQMSQVGLQHLAQSEGFVDYIYDDGAGNPTIGVGHLLTQSEQYSGKIALSSGDVIDVRSGKISQEHILAILADDVKRTEDCVNKAVAVPLSQNQFDALVSFAFNIGCGAFSRSTLLNAFLNKANYSAVPDQLMRWDKAKGKVLKGLANRRRREVSLWLGEQLSTRQFDAIKPQEQYAPQPINQVQQQTDWNHEAELHNIKARAVNEFIRERVKTPTQSRTNQSAVVTAIQFFLMFLVSSFGAPDWIVSPEIIQIVLLIGGAVSSYVTVNYRNKATSFITTALKKAGKAA